MATKAGGVDTLNRNPGMQKLYSRPLLGLVGFAVPMVWKPVAHTVSVLSHSAMHGAVLGIVSTLLTILGFVMVWIGFRKDELTATLLGYMGGALIFMFGLEPSFLMYAKMMDVQPLVYNGVMSLTPNLLVMQATSIAFFIVLIFVGANKDTRCRMFLWFHRNFGLRPGSPTPGYKPQFSRIAAMEAVLISWFFYILIIAVVDPRFLGATHPVTYAFSFGMLFWGLYLLFYKQLQLVSMAGAIRYAVPVVGIIWYFFEIAAIWRWYTEIWVKPFEYPISNAILGGTFLVLLYLAAKAKNRGAQAEK